VRGSRAIGILLPLPFASLLSFEFYQELSSTTSQYASPPLLCSPRHAPCSRTNESLCTRSTFAAHPRARPDDAFQKKAMDVKFQLPRFRSVSAAVGRFDRDFRRLKLRGR